MYSEINYDVADAIATITLNRPDKLNAFTARMMREIIDAFDQIDADDAVRAVIVTGAGRGFCAGADLSAGGETFAQGGSDVQTAVGVPRDGGGLVSLRIFASAKPVIAAINGPAVGVGVTMTLPMDIRLASTDARLGFVFTRRGLLPQEGGVGVHPPRASARGVLELLPAPRRGHRPGDGMGRHRARVRCGRGA